MPTTRAKFKLNSLTLSEGTAPTTDADGKTTWVPAVMHSLDMTPVYGNGDKDHENTKFWQASPNGSLKLGTVNSEAVAHMQVGKEYYIDITPAN